MSKIFMHGRAAVVPLCLAGLLSANPAHAQTPTQWVDGELLIGLRAGMGPERRHGLLREHEASFVEEIGQSTRIARVRVPAAALEATKRRLAKRPEVRFVEKNYIFEPALVPNDPQYASQWHLPQIQAPDAWNISQGGAAAVIAILDSGIDATHPDFAGKLLAGYNTYNNSTTISDVYGHGTEVAGVAAALSNNGLGIAGVAGAAPIMPVRVTDDLGRATSASIANGIVWAADHGARVLNLSFNGVAANATVSSAAQYAYNHGALVVAASGNCACVDPTPENPYILSVSATDEADGLASFSSTGAYVDLSAPGNNIWTTARFGLYTTDSGTSLASPIVSAVAALMIAKNPLLTPALVAQMMESTAIDLGGGGYDSRFGYGRVDAFSAVSAAATYQPPPDTMAPAVTLGLPLSGAKVSGVTVVDVAASDNVGVVKVDLFVDGLFYVTDSLFPYSFAWDTATVANGSHVLYAVATDAAGNSATSASVGVTVSNTAPDTTAPAVAITAPAGSATVSGTTTVSVSASDAGGVAKVDFYVDAVWTATDASAPYAIVWDTSRVANGSHTLQAVATDPSGNTASAVRTVTVANVVNTAPVAANDAFSAPYRAKASYTAQLLNVLANDRDAEGNLNPSTVKVVKAPNQGGTVSVKSNGAVAYTPAKGYRGVETFSYTVSDSLGAVSNTATATISVQ